MTKSQKSKILKMIRKVKSIHADFIKFEKKYEKELKNVHPQFKKSAKNLVDYISLRNHDITNLQNDLGDLGLSRLGRCENHARASLIAIYDSLINIIHTKNSFSLTSPLSIKKGKKLISSNTKALLGYKSKNRRTRIMVTLPVEAANDYKLVYGLLATGMNSARINCAHDGPKEWSEMIENLKKAKKSLGKNCKIIMDLGGPKIRTGSMEIGPKVIHVQPQRDSFGNVIRAGSIVIYGEKQIPEINIGSFIPVSGDISKIKLKMNIRLKDARNKNCSFSVIKKIKNGFIVESDDSIYITPGIKLYFSDAENQNFLIVSDFPPSEQKILLKEDDILILHKSQEPGKSAEINNFGEIIKPAHISCSFPEIFKFIRKGEPVFFDDGKIEGIIQSVTPDGAKIKITSAKESGSKLGADKGINLPKSRISLRGLSLKDKIDLKFISKNADVVAISFVNTVKDIMQLLKELKMSKSKLGIIIKIETIQALKNLPAILLESMRTFPVGVMIARGDLAIECGWLEMAKIQEELLLFCGAAHIPVIWATQVLENMAKKGMPSRAEITDAAMAQRSECVMLNKGPFIFEAVELLNHILKIMEPYRKKMSPMLPKVKKNMIIDI